MMYLTDIATQLKNIMPAVGLGFCLGVFYLIIRFMRLLVFNSKAVIFVTDVLFIVCCTLSSFLLFAAVNNGHIRFYLVVAEVLGYCVFSFTFGEMLFRFFEKIVHIIRRIFSPVLIPLKALKRKCTDIKKKIPENTENFKNKLKKLLKRQADVVYNDKD